VLLNENAFDSDHRQRTEDIAVRAIGPSADPNQFKEVIADLKRLKYIDTKEGRGGGCWLSDSGRRRAEKL
jgi:DNA-binding IscR family transcriptional regulator